MSPEATQRGVATRRIRRRARIWRGWQFPDPATLKMTPEQQLREAAKPRAYFQPRAALTRGELRQIVDNAKIETVQNLRRQLQALRRESDYMRPYHWEQVIKWLGNLRRWPEAEKALETVSAELTEYDL